ncbi:MAG: hypothetical protein ACLR2C_04395 [Parasutterella excrementihominis]
MSTKPDAAPRRDSAPSEGGYGGIPIALLPAVFEVSVLDSALSNDRINASSSKKVEIIERAESILFEIFIGRSRKVSQELGKRVAAHPRASLAQSL